VQALLRRLPRRTWLAALLALHVALLVHSARVHSPTIDEPAHLAAGVADWKNGTFDLYRVNPPLWRMAAALPVLAAGADTRFTPWFRSVDDTTRAEGIAGLDFARDNGARYFDLLFLARLVTVAWSALGALLVFRWAREMFGERAAHLGCVLWCLEPMVLGHAPLVTPDIPAAVSALATTYAFWRWARRPSWGGAAVVGVVLGIAQLTKFTNLVLYLVLPSLGLAWHVVRRRLPEARRRSPSGPRRALAQVALILATSLVVLDAGYGFRETGAALGSYRFASEALSGHTFTDEERYAEVPGATRTGNRFSGTALGRLPVPVPRNYLQGIDLQRVDFDRRLRSYLHGRWQHGGWWHYYFDALAVKAPLGSWILVVSGVVAAAIGLRRRPQLLFCLLPPLAFLGLLTSQSGFSAHLRYALPAFPFLFVIGGGMARSIRGAPGKVAVAALAGWSALASLRVHPHSMSYFNELAGGAERGPEYLVDSNVDWGQDLLLLRRWIAEHPEAAAIGVAYVGPIDPSLAGVHHDYVPVNAADLAASTDRIGVQPGYFAASVNLVRGIRFGIRDRNGRLHKVGADDYRRLIDIAPVDRAGYSISIFLLTQEQADSINEDIRRRLGLQSGRRSSDLPDPGRAHLDISVATTEAVQ
jgi:4-amino-4-deoxy-L-arabinose transferase-like glycosyltransferase